ncbi:restriction endonuclease subunit S [Enterococcus faecium]|uniref:restriction endonuclease subunit S n=1 Tax=Enterococcus TaxID=1350 RepID=UPI000CF2F802|nr:MULTISPECIES: restriction endonuclease subunit S [Enterococcus]EGP5528642.1 restriction endonuclease subunit S [Enterococcus faecium]EME7221318.1 restriction endonuclease subunit S [Enterococcus faecium]EMF0381106.1 restriction endonuclease subunit S [Enterococcus faecium]MBM3075615.1 restriction endonuclease subunit S [Enterococcus lactis]MCA6754425.1 restriction endonuclease subunit S [Enterococcus lactis]
MSNDTLPEIRFPEFTDEWEQRKLSDEMTDFIVPMRDKPKEFGGNIPWTRIEDIEGKFLNDSLSEQYVTEETIQKMNLKIIPKDSLIVSSSATFGVVAVVTQNLITNQTFIGLVPREKNTLDYWYSFFQSSEARKYMKLQSAGSTIFYIARDSFEKMPISVPKIDEMIKIGEYFSNLDNLITLHHRKLDLLKETKKGFLQKMFPKNGAKVPEIRFPGFTEDWEQRRLSDVASIVGGGTPSTSNPEYWDGDIDWYAPAEIGDQIYVSKSLKTITELGQQKSSAKILPIGTVLFTSRAGIGNTAILAKEGTTNQGFQSIVPHKNKLDSYFIFSRTHELKRYGEVTGAGSTFAEVSGKQMAKMPILIPCINEQRKIGAFFEQLDTTITLHQRELDVLKETKKGFLQKMFV